MSDTLKGDGWTLNPDDLPPRLLRFHSGLTGDIPVAVLEPQRNLLHIDKSVYDTLTPLQQHLLVRTRRRETWLVDL